MISAVVHTYNEEKNIERSLSSLVNWVDEIVLVDMNSTDSTCKKAKEFKARILDFPYTGFVEPARNFGIENARGDWIIILDADEEIPRVLSKKLLSVIKADQADFVRLPRKNIIWGKWIKHAGWWPDYQIRLFKKGNVTWTDKIHGIPFTRGHGFDLETDEEYSIIHYNYQSVEQYIARLNRYTSVSAKELFFGEKKFQPSSVIEASVGEFVKRFFVREGYKDGLHGFALAFIQGFSEGIIQLKRWELENFREEHLTLKDAQKFTGYEVSQKNYWLYNELLKKPHHIWEDLIWRIRRKLSSYG